MNSLIIFVTLVLFLTLDLFFPEASYGSKFAISITIVVVTRALGEILTNKVDRYDEHIRNQS